jgi:hypothetical protein
MRDVYDRLILIRPAVIVFPIAYFFRNFLVLFSTSPKSGDEIRLLTRTALAAGPEELPRPNRPLSHLSSHCTLYLHYYYWHYITMASRTSGNSTALRRLMTEYKQLTSGGESICAVWPLRLSH